MIAPPLELHYSTEKNGVQVNGHKSRCNALDQIWKDRFQIDKKLSPIVVADIAPHKLCDSMWKELIHKNDCFGIEITDVPLASMENANIVIDYNIGKESELDRYSPVWESSALLLGEAMFIADYWVRDARENMELISGPDNLVLMIPNGNRNQFLDELGDINNLVKSFGSTSFSVFQNRQRAEMLSELVWSKVVITTPSVTAMECIAIGIPVLLIKTSGDQTGEFVKYNYAEWYSEDILSLYLRNENIRKAAIPKRIPVDNSVVSKIYNKWSEWHESQ